MIVLQSDEGTEQRDAEQRLRLRRWMASRGFIREAEIDSDDGQDESGVCDGC